MEYFFGLITTFNYVFKKLISKTTFNVYRSEFFDIAKSRAVDECDDISTLPEPINLSAGRRHCFNLVQTAFITVPYALSVAPSTTYIIHTLHAHVSNNCRNAKPVGAITGEYFPTVFVVGTPGAAV